MTIYTFTPGPWKHIQDYLVTTADESQTIAFTENTKNTYQQNFANAQIIALAPELLKELEEGDKIFAWFLDNIQNLDSKTQKLFIAWDKSRRATILKAYI